MDPLTALSLASNILAFIDFSAKAISGAVDIYGSPSGLTEENASAEAVAAEMRSFAAKLRTTQDERLTGNEAALCRLGNECDGLSEQIIDLVEKVKLKDPSSKTQSLVAGLKSKWYEGDRQKLEKRLDSCRAQLALQLNYLASSNINDQLESLMASAVHDASKFEQLSTQVGQLERDLEVLSRNATVKPQLDSLCGVSDRAANLLAQQYTLKGLAFQDMYGRYEAVDMAHYKTFRWIFSQGFMGQFPALELGARAQEVKSTNRGQQSKATLLKYREEADERHELEEASPVDPVKAAARDALIGWLFGGDGIFHISGKLGSGKSTLMKYLCEHKSTMALLRTWAGQRTLVFASFFFWKPGSQMQKSLTGLLRGLLHDVLDASPELIPHVLPDHWRAMRSVPWQAMNEAHFSDQDIRRAFLRLTSGDEAYEDHCFCFFIDGLDEFEGTIQDDTKSLVEQLCSWTTTSKGKVKLCVSSREYNVFMNTFSETKRIRLHQLTRSDMDGYVADKLDHPELGDTAAIRRAVVDNARGMFLWVVLVVKRIREQIENGVSGGDLEQEIEALPQEMEGLLSHLLDSLSESDLRRAYQAFAILLELRNYHYARPDHLYISTLAYSFLADYNKSRPNAAAALQTGQLSPDQRTSRAASALKRLNGCCSGLVEAVHTYADATYRNSTYDRAIEFTHRSVPEFLASKSRRDHMQSLLGDFDAIDAFTHCILAELSAYPQSLRRQNGGGAVAMLVSLRTQYKLDGPPYSFLEILSETISDARSLLHPPLIRMSSLQMHIFNGTGYDLVAHCNHPSQLHAAGAQPPQDPVYQAVFCGNFEYVRWKLRELENASHPEMRLAVILYCIVKLRPADEACQREALETVEHLISRGLSPEVQTDISRLPVDAYEHPDDPTSNAFGCWNLSIWHHLLLACYDYTLWDMRDHLPWLGRILEVYLEHGADPFFEFCVAKEEEESDEAANPEQTPEPAPPPSERGSMSDWDFSDAHDDAAWVFELTVGKETRQLQLRYGDISWVSQLNDRTYSCRAASLSEFIRLYDFPNEGRLLELVDRNMRILEGSDEANFQNFLSDNTKTDEKTEEVGEVTAGPGSTGLAPQNAVSLPWLALGCLVGILIAFIASRLSG